MKNMKSTRALLQTILAGIIMLSVSVQASLIAYYNFDNAANGGLASVGTNATLGSAASISVSDMAVGAGSLFLNGPTVDTAGNDGAVSGNNFTWATDTRSINFWMKANTNATQDPSPTMISLGGGTGNGQRFDVRMSSGFLRLEVQGGGVTTGVYVGDGNWYNVTITCGDPATVATCQYYVYDSSASLVASGSFTGSTTAIDTDVGPLRIGDSFRDTSRDFFGYIDEVRLYNNQLTQSDALALAQLWNPAPPTLPVISQQPASQTVATNWPVNFSVGVLGDVIGYQWFTSGDTNYTSPGLIPNATNSTYAIGAASFGDATNYFVVITNSYGSVTSSVATLTVNVPSTLAWLGGVNGNWDQTAANWSNTVTMAGGVIFQNADNVQFTDSGNSASAVSLVGNLLPYSVSVMSSSNYVFSGSGKLTGLTGITKSGTGTLALNTANTFTGNVVISGGVLRAGNGSALGATNGNTTINDGGSLDVNGQNLGLEEIAVQGGGAAGTNAIFNGSGAQAQSAIARLVLNGPTVITADTRWDVNGTSGNGYMHGNGNSLTKVGSGTVFLNGVGDTGLGDVQILGGALGFQGVVGMGISNATMTVSNAELAFWSTQPPSPLAKNLILINGKMSSGGGIGFNKFYGPITLEGTNTMAANNADLYLYGPLVGTGGISKSGSGQLYLEGTNTFTGDTFISAGTVSIGAASTLDTSSVIRLSPSTILDASARPSYSVNRGNGQSLQGVGNSAVEADIYANVTNSAGSTLEPGVSGPGSMYINGNLTLGGSTLAIKLGADPYQIGNGVNDYIAVFGDLNLSGLNTIQITPTATLSSQTYTILTYSGFLSGNLANLTATCSNPNYVVSVVDPATTPGSIQVTISGDYAPLIWKGGQLPAPNVWDHTVTNWLKSSTSKFVRFYDADQVIFDDSAVTNIVNVTDTNFVSDMVLSNSALNYTFVGSGELTGSLAKEGAGVDTFRVLLALSGITNDNGIIALDPPTNQSLAAVISDNGSGQGTVLKTGTNQLTLTADNSGFYGPMVVENGVLRYNNSLALGWGSLTATNTGTIDVNNVNADSKNILISGSGYDGQGALANLAATSLSPYKFVNYVTLAGDAAIGGSARLDIALSMTGNGFKLTKVGDSPLVLNNIGDTGLGDVEIDSGKLTFQGSATMGNPSKILTVNSNAVLGLWAGTSSFDKNILMDNAILTSGGSVSSNVVVGSISLTGTNTFVADTALALQSTVSGSGHLVKNGTATLTVSSNNYTGNTMVNAGTLILSQPMLGTNSTVSIASGAKLLLTFAETNTVSALVLNGVSQPVGVYNSSTSGSYLDGTGSLQVAISGPTGPALLTNSVSGNILSLSWPAGQGWRLQSQTNSLGTGLGTKWVYMTDGSVSSTNITVGTHPSVFYRLVYP